MRFVFLICAVIPMVAVAHSPAPLEIVDYDLTPEKADVLTGMIEEMSFPLSAADQTFIEALKQKVLEMQAAGLAAPQVGVAKQIIAFHVPAEALKYRWDVTTLVPLTVFINPSYEPILEKGRSLGWERCFSGKNHAGKVWRWNAIRYKAQDINGTPVEGIAIGFEARLLQHEIDHCQGTLCFHRYASESPQGSVEQLKALALEEIQQEKTAMGLQADELFPLAQN